MRSQQMVGNGRFPWEVPVGKHGDGKGEDTPPSPYTDPRQQGDGQAPDGVLGEGDGKHKKPKDDD